MKIAIHDSGERFFSKGWIEFCQEHRIDYKLVNCHKNNIIKEVSDCDIIMFHHCNNVYSEQLFAKQLLFAIQKSGKRVFPDFNTNWHFDDKIAQKYLFEALNIPMVQTYVFYTEKEALAWVDKATFPKVSKLRGGAGSQNVQLIRSPKYARRYIRRSFRRGFSQYDAIHRLKDELNLFRENKHNYFGIIRALLRLIMSTPYSRMGIREKGYVLLQDFIPNNKFDIRVIVTANRAFAIKRMVRYNDFRASGSGKIKYDKDEINIDCIRIAFSVNALLSAQSIAFDFIFDEKNNPLIVEISYGYEVDYYYECPGYWDSDLIWHNEKINPTAWMIEEIIANLTV